MAYWHVEAGTLIKRWVTPPVNPDEYADEAALLAELASRNIYPESVAATTFEDWEYPGGRVETWNAADQRVDVTIQVQTWPLDEYKLKLAQQVFSVAYANPKFTDRELILAIADYALPVNVLPDAYRDLVLNEEQAILSGIRNKLAAIRTAATHAEAKSAYDA